MLRGTIVQGYTLIQRIGQGTFGIVYTCKDEHSNDTSVMKLITVDDMSNEDQEACLTEVQVLAQMVKYECKYIIKYINSFVSDNSLCLVMEYASGGNLRQLLKSSDEGLKTSQILTYMACIASALHCMHSIDILHRDLKSANVFINEKYCKIGDFGLSRILTNPSSLAKSVVGTPYYLSPEMCNGNSYNSKTDLWSFGIILFEMCTTGSYPFKANNQAALVLQIAECRLDKQRLRDITSSHGSSFSSLLDRCLTKDPRRRPSALQVCAADCCYTNACRENVDLPDEVHEIYRRNVCNQIRAHPLASISSCDDGIVEPQQQHPTHLRLRNTIASRRVRKGAPVPGQHLIRNNHQREKPPIPSQAVHHKRAPVQKPQQGKVIHSGYRSSKARERDINLVNQLPDVVSSESSCKYSDPTGPVFSKNITNCNVDGNELHLYKDLLPIDPVEPEISDPEPEVVYDDDVDFDNQISPVMQTTGISWAVVGSNGTETTGAVMNTWREIPIQEEEEEEDEETSSLSSYEPPSEELIAVRRVDLLSKISDLESEQSTISCTASEYDVVVDLLHSGEMNSDDVHSLSPELVKLLRLLYRKILLESELRDLS